MLSLSRRTLMLLAGASLLPGAIALAQRDTSRQDEGAGARLKRVFANLSDDAERLVSDDQVTGISIGVSDGHNRKAAYFGYADTECRTPVDELTQFRIASITKPLTATTVLKLKEMGHLSLDQTIERYFPDFPRAHEITIYHLLTHTSGIPNWWGLLPFNTPDEFMSDREAHRWLARMDTTSLFAPGTQRDYSNSGYLLLGAIIENVTGQTYQEALQRLVLSKAGAILTELENPRRPKPRWAKGYIMSDDKFVQTGFEPMPFAAGGLRSRVNDLLSFSDALFNGMLISAESLAEMTQHAVLSDGRLVQDGLYTAPGSDPLPWPDNTTELGYGLGMNTWIQAGERYYSHAGLISGFGAYWIYAPRTNITAVLLANTQGGTGDIHQALRDCLASA